MMKVSQLGMIMLAGALLGGCEHGSGMSANEGEEWNGASGACMDWRVEWKMTKHVNGTYNGRSTDTWVNQAGCGNKGDPQVIMYADVAAIIRNDTITAFRYNIKTEAGADGQKWCVYRGALLVNNNNSYTTNNGVEICYPSTTTGDWKITIPR